MQRLGRGPAAEKPLLLNLPPCDPEDSWWKRPGVGGVNLLVGGSGDFLNVVISHVALTCLVVE